MSLLQIPVIAATGRAGATFLKVSSSTVCTKCHAKLRQALTTHHAEQMTFTGARLSCVEESSRQAVIDYKATMWPINQVGHLSVSSKVTMLTCVGMYSSRAR